MDPTGQALPSERLLAVIETQNRLAAAALDAQAVMDVVVARAQELIGSAAGVVELVEEGEMVYHAASGTAEPYIGLRLRADSSLSGLCVSRDETLYCKDARSDPRVDREACERVGAISMLCVPLSHDARTVGVLKVYDPRPCAFDAGDIEVVSLLSSVIGAHMAHATDYQRQWHAGHHDVLTGLLNRRSFDGRLAAEAARVRRHGATVALCLLDLDRFKQVNDTMGHAAGDEVLRSVARHVHGLRVEDAAYRIGGDEFALILVGATETDAIVALERIAAAVGEDPSARGIEVSWGVTSLASDPVASFERAGAALYAVKQRAA